ncbi:MAG: hypothetical protein Q8908_04895, partial [Bacteroidota bacterium]|nr:hypothetical protein [Bacteroidota bacterium]
LLPLALVIFSGSSILSFGVFQRILKRSPQQFINYYMLFSFMKMIVLLFLLVIMALIIRSEAMALIIWYGILFAVFIPVETIFAIKLARKKDNTNP